MRVRGSLSRLAGAGAAAATTANVRAFSARGRVAAVALGGALLATLTASPAVAAPPDRGVSQDEVAVAAEHKRRNDKDPHVPFTAETRALQAKKDAMGRDFRRQQTGGDVSTSALVRRMSKQLPNAVRQLQLNSYYCGPAAASMALRIRGLSVSQTTMAGHLRTTTNGTAWSGVNANVPSNYQTGYPMPDAMNYRLGYKWFVPVALSYSPTSTEKAKYRENLWVIDNGYPMVGDAWESPSGPRLAGHPTGVEIFHWYTIYGYYNWGSGTYYLDSAGFAANGGYGSIGSDTLTTINGGRGYVY